MKIKRLILLPAVLASVAGALAITPVKNGKSQGRIIVEGDRVTNTSGHLLQNFVEKISGVKLPVVENVKAKKNDFVIRNDNSGKLSEDAFAISTDNGVMTISGNKKGAIYGVVTLLDDYMGVNYYGPDEYSLTETSTIDLPDINIQQTPGFRYRQSQSYALTDSIYRMWMRLEEPRDEFAAGYWVHTFNRLLPSDVYGESHPEYYAVINGKRQPGSASQWCLSNPEVFKIVSERIDSIFEAYPGLNMISVSQNDGNNTYCTCELCSAVMKEEGSVSGPYIRFLNKLAERRPDKQFSTLAYLFTMHPPHKTKPLPNVNIMLCDIDVKREVPLTDNATGRDFVKALEGWSKISDNIFVWDYGINFDNYLDPFPNFPIMQPNIQLFRDNNVKMHFSQIAGSKGGDFTELRTYIASKLMWNPDVNVDSLMHDFMNGYYGAAAPYLYEYEKLLEGALLGSNKELWIYDSHVTHKDGMLNAKLRKRYNELFDRAEAAVANDKEKLDRVRRQRLTLQHSELEIARAEGRASDPETGKLLDLFEKRVIEYDIPTTNERSNSPVDYCKLYRERYAKVDKNNLAAGIEPKFTVEPTGKYAAMGQKGLTDGIYGGATFADSWIGWEAKDGEFVLDLGKVQPVKTVEGDFLHQLGAWIFFPKSMTVSYSTDGNNYTTLGHVDNPEDRGVQVKFKKISVDSPKPVDARYIKVNIEGIKTCPGWHYGVGQPAWFFIDEIVVK